jgi:hypothetical protein
LESPGSYCDCLNVENPINFSCFFDKDDDFRLKLSVEVPTIWKQENQLSWDTREITLISEEKLKTQDTSGVRWTVFNSMDATPETDCMGVEKDGRIIFTDIRESENCHFTQSEQIADGVIWYSFKSSVGYDDLYDETTDGIKRYGRNWNLECRIKGRLLLTKIIKFWFCYFRRFTQFLS